MCTQADTFGPLLAHLDPAGAEVMVADPPGHGASSMSSVRYAAGYFTDVARAPLEVWALAVAAKSIGGSIALGLGARRNPPEARVIAINPHDYGRRGARAAALTRNGHFSSLDRPREVAQLTHELA
jgi:pimeloyl-ACP methyl ester carboxylesterase